MSDVDSLRQKTASAFPAGTLVDHTGLPTLPSRRDLPRYLIDFLVGVHGVAGAEKVITNRLPTNDTRQLLRHRLLSARMIQILDFVEVRVDLQRGFSVADLMAFQYKGVYVNPSLLDRHPDLLSGGMWGSVCLMYAGGCAIGSAPELVMIHFQPYQPPVVNETFVQARQKFTTSEWIDLLLQSAGYNPDALFHDRDGRRLRWLYLARLLPMVEPNVNLVELGPKNTGKTYLLRNLSAQTHSMAGGYASPANLFYNLSTGRGGLVTSRKVVVFDEIALARFTDDSGTIALLKDFMESGQFSRGRGVQSAETSIVFLGNIDVDGQQPSSRYAHLFDPLPAELQDPALIDRIHGYIPGWEMPKLAPRQVSPAYSLSSDYFGEILLSLRRLPYNHHWQTVIKAHPPLEEMTGRDFTAVERLGRAFFKLVFPDGQYTEPEATEILSIVGELRQRVEYQLEVMDPGEFAPHRVGYAGAETSEASHPGVIVDFAAHTASDQLDTRANTAPVAGEVTALTTLSAHGREIGGALQIVQVAARAGGSGQCHVTGHHGSAVSHSAQTAHSYLLQHSAEIGSALQRIHTVDLDIQLVTLRPIIDTTATGLALLLAMASALLRTPVTSALAVTGGVSLHGDILPVTGIAHKLTAATRRGRRVLLLPEGNRPDLDALPARLRASLELCFVRNVQEAMQRALR